MGKAGGRLGACAPVYARLSAQQNLVAGVACGRGGARVALCGVQSSAHRGGALGGLRRVRGGTKFKGLGGLPGTAGRRNELQARRGWRRTP